MEQPFERWEHMIILLEADAEKQQAALRQRWPSKHFTPYTPLALVPQLDTYGDLGWELISIQPVIMGHNEDIAVSPQGTAYRTWTNSYLCTFKRRKHG